MLDLTIINAAKKEGKISERALVGLRTLKTCDNWKKVIPLGLINYKTTLTNYQGILVVLDNRVYFMSKEIYEAIKKDLKWDVTKTIRVE